MRLINGDCLQEMDKLIEEGIKVDAIITDPPYGVLKGHKIETDIDIELFFEKCSTIMKDNSFIAFFGMMPTLNEWINQANKIFKYKEMITWYKGNSSPVLKILRVYENILIYSKGKPSFNICREDIDRTMHELYEKITYKRAIAELKRMLKEGTTDLKSNSSNRKNDEIYKGYGTKEFNHTQPDLKRNVTNLWSFRPHNKQRFNNTENNIKHPTVKPIQLMERLIRLLSKPEDIILDPFMGSGTTGIGCKKLNRKFIGIEIDKSYFELSKDRIEQEEVQYNLFEV